MSPSATTSTPTGQSILNTAKTQDGEVKRIRKIPEFSTKEATRQWQLKQMAGAFRIFAKLGYADGSSGHISLRGIAIHALLSNNTLMRCRSGSTRYFLDQSIWRSLRVTDCLRHGSY